MEVIYKGYIYRYPLPLREVLRCSLMPGATYAMTLASGQPVQSRYQSRKPIAPTGDFQIEKGTALLFKHSNRMWVWVDYRTDAEPEAHVEVRAYSGRAEFEGELVKVETVDGEPVYGETLRRLEDTLNV